MQHDRSAQPVLAQPRIETHVWTAAGSARVGAALVHKGHRLRPLHVSGCEGVDREAGCIDQALDRPIEVAATGEVLPYRRQPMLPCHYPAVRRETMLDKEQGAAGLEDAADLV